MRTRTHPVVLALALLLPLAACAPQNGEEPGPADTAEVDETAEAAETGMEIQEEPVFGAQRMPCEDVAEYLGSESTTESTPDTIEIALEVKGDRVVASPAMAVVDRGSTVQWSSDDLTWVVAFKDGLSPFAEGQMNVRGTVPGEPGPPEGRGRVGADCGYYVYVIGASRGNSVFVSDPHLWVK